HSDSLTLNLRPLCESINIPFGYWHRHRHQDMELPTARLLFVVLQIANTLVLEPKKIAAEATVMKASSNAYSSTSCPWDSFKNSATNRRIALSPVLSLR